MQANPVIELKNIGKRYPLATTPFERVRTLYALMRNRDDFASFRALHDISLSIQRGESLGVVGENGAGKSTLLKVIAGVVKPSSGRLHVNGKIGALLELGAGFHPEYTGRENIYLAAALMGIDREQFDSKIDEIIAFADIGEHIDQPIKHYSSGMVVRLGFAVATSMRPDVLITDEVLAVGDESFQKKCIRWMESYLSEGGTLLLCSHSMFHIQKLCQKAIWIQDGEARFYGEAIEVTRQYMAFHEDRGRQAGQHYSDRAKAEAAGIYTVRDLWLESGGERITVFRMGEVFSGQGLIYSPDDCVPTVAIGILRIDGTPIYGLSGDMENYFPNRLASNLYGFRFDLLENLLLPGRYIFRAHAMDTEGMRVFDTLETTFDVVGDSRELGFCQLKHQWMPSGPTVDL